MKIFIFLLLALSSICSFGQNGWSWTELPPMPTPVANNAVTHGFSGDTLCVYSFCGIDTTKTPAGIHLDSWRYNTVTQVWTSLPPVPDFQGKIAAGANTIDNLIYLVGGYYVEDNFSETSSDDIHIFDPNTNQWLADGANIPIAIDDQVQCVYQESLLYVITGWSNTSNVSAVQIYNPELDEWSVGTSMPNSNAYRAFGASGEIVGDTIFYMGGVSSGTFAANNKLRKGVIDPSDPTVINWELMDDFIGDPGYRMACGKFEDRVFWIGGSSVAYNFDAIAYNGSGGVEPEFRIATYFSEAGVWDEGLGAPFGQMDFRGLARVSPTSWIICGGIEEGQQVSDRVFLLELDPASGLFELDYDECSVSFEAGSIVNRCYDQKSYRLMDLSGRVVASGILAPGGSKQIDKSFDGQQLVLSCDATATILPISR